MCLNNNVVRILKNRESQILYLLIVLILTLVTYRLNSIYGPAHWQGWSSGPRESEIIGLKVASGVGSDSPYAIVFDDIGRRAGESVEAAGAIVRTLDSLRITGFLALVISIVALFRMTGFYRFLPLPFGLYSAYLASIIM